MTDFRALCAELVEKWDNAAELDDLCDVADVMDRARAALAQPEQQGPTDEEAVALYSEVMAFHDCKTLGDMAGHFARAVLARWGRAAIEPVPVSEGLPPRVGHILRLAEIIREVDGNHDKGAAVLAEAILSHPGSRWSPAIEPVPVAERLPGPEDCDGEGWCWMYEPDGVWWQVLIEAPSIMPSLTHWLPHHALPVPQP
jgi:hypothetical protein